jgi:hypothetical protein
MAISLRPHAAREKSLTLKSWVVMGALLYGWRRYIKISAYLQPRFDSAGIFANQRSGRAGQWYSDVMIDSCEAMVRVRRSSYLPETLGDQAKGDQIAQIAP